MPKVGEIDGLSITIYPNDHRSAHVHVIGEHEAVFALNCPGGPPSLQENYGFSAKELKKIQKALAVSALCKEWSKIHGDD